MSFFSSLLGIGTAVAGVATGNIGLVGAGLGLYGAGESASSAQESANAGYNYQTSVLQNRHQWEVEDLKKAGLNPILSATSSSGGSGSAVSSAYDYSTPYAQALNAYLNLNKLKSEINVMNSNAKKNESDIAVNQATISNVMTQIANGAKDLEIKGAELDNLRERLKQEKQITLQQGITTRSHQIDLDRKERAEGGRTSKRIISLPDLVYDIIGLGK